MKIIPQVIQNYLNEYENWHQLKMKKQMQDAMNLFFLMLSIMAIISLSTLIVDSEKINNMSIKNLFFFGSLFGGLIIVAIIMNICNSLKGKKEIQKKYQKLQELKKFANVWVENEDNLKTVLQATENKYYEDKEIMEKILNIKAFVMKKEYEKVFSELANLNNIIKISEERQKLAIAFDERENSIEFNG